MKKNLRVVVYLMIVVIAAAGIYLWSQNQDEKEVLKNLDPENFDISASCSEIQDHILVCNAGNDEYLYLDGVKVYLQKSDTVIHENGDEEVKVTYKTYTMEEFQKDIEAKGDVPVALYLTANGKVKAIMVLEQSFENKNASLGSLENLDPSGYDSANVILSMDGEHMRLAPVNYTEAEADKFTGLVHDYPYGKAVGYYKETVTTTVDAEGNRYRNIQYAKSSEEEIKQNLGEGQNVYIWYNADGSISAVMLHQENVILAENKSAQ